MAIVEKTRNNKRWQGYREKVTLVHCWWEATTVDKTKNRITIGSSNPLPGINPKKNENTNLER